MPPVAAQPALHSFPEPEHFHLQKQLRISTFPCVHLHEIPSSKSTYVACKDQLTKSALRLPLSIIHHRRNTRASLRNRSIDHPVELVDILHLPLRPSLLRHHKDARRPMRPPSQPITQRAIGLHLMLARRIHHERKRHTMRLEPPTRKPSQIILVRN